MGTYETLFITLPTLSEAEEATVVSGLAEIISDGGGKMVAQDRLGRRRLAYPIKKCDDGVYNLFVYEAGPEVIRELERRIRISDKVLRWLTVRMEKQWEEEAKEKAVRDAEARRHAEKVKAEAAEKAKAEARRREAEAAEEAKQAEGAEEAGETGESGETDATTVSVAESDVTDERVDEEEKA